MGIRGLESFIRRSDKNIAQTIHIRDEIAKWRRDHSKDPTIIIDIEQLNKVVELMDEDALLLGGDFDTRNKMLEYFFSEIKDCGAKLVFIARLDDKRYMDIDEFEPFFRIYDSIAKNGSLKKRKHAATNKPRQMSGALRPNERMWYNLLKICSEYGEVKANYGLCLRSVFAYVREYRDDVMAEITRDTEFFIYDVNFEFWSLSAIELNTLKITSFSRQLLNDAHGLSYDQMQLLYAIFEVKSFDPKFKFFDKKVEFIKKQKVDQNGYTLVGRFTADQCEKIDNLMSEIKEISNFSGKSTDDIYNDLVAKLITHDRGFTELVQFFKEKIFFAYKLVNEKISSRTDLLFLDVRSKDSKLFIDLVIETTLKLIGVAFKDVEQNIRPKTRMMQIKRDNFRAAEQIQKDIIFPTMTLPSLITLITQKDDPALDSAKWSLLQWLLNVKDDVISEIRASEESKFIRIVMLTLQFLLSHKMITERDFNEILKLEKQLETKNMTSVERSSRGPPPLPKTRYPNHIKVAWIQTAHKYTIAFEMVCHCLELSGLRQETALIQFEAYEFHERMQEMVHQVERGSLRRNHREEDMGPLNRNDAKLSKQFRRMDLD